MSRVSAQILSGLEPGEEVVVGAAHGAGAGGSPPSRATSAPDEPRI